jgi:hypothetical protein
VANPPSDQARRERAADVWSSPVNTIKLILLVKRFQEIPSSVLKEQFDQTAREMTSEIARLFQLDEAT